MAPYGLDLVARDARVTDIGQHMKVMGQLPRHFKPSDGQYCDEFVKDFIDSRGEDFSYYDEFDVVAKHAAFARQSLSRYDRCEDPFSEKVKSLYDVAESWLGKEFGGFLCESRVLSNDAVEQHLSWNKSPGAPWNLIGMQSKGEFYEQKAEFYAMYWEKLASEDHIRSLSSSSIKEELRTVDKIKDGNVRTIISMDVAHVKAHSQLCLDQNEKLIHTATKHSSALGIVMQSGGWDALDKEMSCFGPLPCTIELDGKRFDSKFRYYCMRKIRNFRFSMLAKEFQTKDNWLRLTNLYWELCFSPFVDVDGHVYSRCSGNPSGQACTTPDNIFKNFMDIVVLWHLIMPVSYHNYEDFHRLLRMCIVGDDINLSVHPSIHHLFNIAAIMKYQSEIDMEYTTPCVNFRHNRDCEFLGHGFEMMLGVLVPKIDCRRMRTSMLKFNVSGLIWETIARACGLRNETFACTLCRDWFADLLKDLRRKHGDDTDPMVVEAWKAYKSDADLWSLYTGLSFSDVYNALASVETSPENKIISHHSVSSCSDCFFC